MSQFSTIAGVAKQPIGSEQQQELSRQILRKYWGYDQFRPGQWDIVQTLLQGEDLLAVLPTGSGKSLCFQIPALGRKGLTLVVSPLIALMEDQVSNLQTRGVAAACLHSQQDPEQRRQTLRELRRLKLLYLSPETLFSTKVWRQLQLPHLQIAGLIIDEAHCITQWGESFRPAYDRLGAVRHALLATKPLGSHFPVAAFTATADRPTRQAICTSLGLQAPVLWVRSPKRPNIDLQLERVWTPRQRRQKALAFLKAQGNTAATMPSGLVYVRRRRDTETLAEQFTAGGFPTVAYHGGLSPRRRRQIEQAWIQGGAQGGLPFVICTSAFGMGVDLPSCRWILHYHLPLLLTEYVQEIGRAGRDGQPSVAMALASEPSGWLDPSDRQRDRYFLQAFADQQQRCRAIAKQLPPAGSLEQIQQKYPQAGALTLAWLHQQEKLQWSDPFNYHLTSDFKGTNFLDRKEFTNPQAIKRFKAHQGNRWQLIEEAFR